VTPALSTTNRAPPVLDATGAVGGAGVSTVGRAPPRRDVTPWRATPPTAPKPVEMATLVQFMG
jgi:hypothetical protein